MKTIILTMIVISNSLPAIAGKDISNSKEVLCKEVYSGINRYYLGTPKNPGELVSSLTNSLKRSLDLKGEASTVNDSIAKGNGNEASKLKVALDEKMATREMSKFCDTWDFSRIKEIDYEHKLSDMNCDNAKEWVVKKNKALKPVSDSIEKGHLCDGPSHYTGGYDDKPLKRVNLPD